MYQPFYYQSVPQYGFDSYASQPLYGAYEGNYGNYGNYGDLYGHDDYYELTSGSQYKSLNNLGYSFDYPGYRGSYSFVAQPVQFVDEGYVKQLPKVEKSESQKSSSSKKRKAAAKEAATLKPKPIPSTQTYASLYGKNYVVTQHETEIIQKHFNKHKTIDLAGFKKLTAELCQQEGLDEIAEEHFNEFDADNDGQLNFDDFLLAYAYVRHRKYGKAGLSLRYF